MFLALRFQINTSTFQQLLSHFQELIQHLIPICIIIQFGELNDCTINQHPCWFLYLSQPLWHHQAPFSSMVFNFFQFFILLQHHSTPSKSSDLLLQWFSRQLNLPTCNMESLTHTPQTKTVSSYERKQLSLFSGSVC